MLRLQQTSNYYPRCSLPDVAHDVLEGVAADAIFHLLRFAKKECGLTEKDFNHAVKEFNEEADALEKYQGLPIPKFKFHVLDTGKSDGLFKATFAQTRTLVTRFFFILNKTVVGTRKDLYNSTQFKIFRNFLLMTGFLFSSYLHQESDPIEFDLLSQSFLKQTILYNSDYDIKPKGHNLTHYKTNFIMYGPPKHFSTMCDERAMGDLKDAIKSHQNPCQQIAKAFKHQMEFYVADFENNFSKLPNGGKYRKPYGDEQLELNGEHRCFKSIRFNGAFFAQGLAITLCRPSKNWLSSETFSIAQFYIIKDIVEMNFELKLIVAPLKIICLNNFFVALECEIVETKCKLVSVNDLFIKKTFSIRKFDKSYFVVIDGLPVKKF